MSHDQQAQRLREIDDLLAECQRHAMPGVRVSYAQLRALRDAIAAPVPPAAVAEVADEVVSFLSHIGFALDDREEQALRAILAATHAPVAQNVPNNVARDALKEIADCICDNDYTRKARAALAMLATAQAQERKP